MRSMADMLCWFIGSPRLAVVVPHVDRNTISSLGLFGRELRQICHKMTSP